MNAIYQALEEGYSPEDLIKYLSKSMPKMAEPIRKASKAGYTIQQILGFLSKNFDTEDRRGMTETERLAANRRSDAAMTKYGLKMAGAAVAAPIAGLAARSALSHALPRSLTHGIGPQAIGGSSSGMIKPEPQPSTQSPTGITPTEQQSLQPSQQPPSNEPNIPQAALPSQPEQKIIDPTALLSKHGLLKHVDEIAKKQKDPKAIAGILYSKYPKEMREFQKESGKNMEDAIGDYLQSKPQEMIKPEEEKPTISKNETVASSQGIGEVKEIRNGKALVEVDGKKHVVNEDELIQSPLPEKELSDLYEDLISGIEKKSGKQISRNVEWAGYDPKTNELAYKPHGSDKLYAYDNISPEDVELLTSLLTQRKSTGENFIGAWEAGTESPIGAAMYQLIRKLQSERGGKGSEYKNRYETIYDALELAKKALKEKHAERKKKAKKSRID